MYKLLIAEASEPYVDALTDIFKNEFILRVSRDGESTLQELVDFQPNVLILDYALPGKDGLTALQQSAHRPAVILGISAYMNSYTEQLATAAGVQFTMITPTVDSLRVRLMDLIATTIAPKSDLESQAAVHLHTLTFSTHLDGYRQLRVGIPIFAKNPNMRLSKELYPAIGARFGELDARTVEHSIRKSIEAAWLHKNPVVWLKYFPPKSDGTISCPTNKVFLSRLAEMLELP